MKGGARRAGRLPVPRRWLAIVVVAAATAGAAGGVLLQHLQNAQSAGLPVFHGQQSWNAGVNPAPPISLHDQNGARITLASLRGQPVLLTFLDSRCRSECPIEGKEIGAIMNGLDPADRPNVVVVSVDQKGDTTASIRRAVKHWDLNGDWRTLWLNGTAKQLATVWRSYKIAVVPHSGDVVHSLALYLIDGRGDERTGYLFPFLPGFVSSDLKRLAHEQV